MSKLQIQPRVQGRWLGLSDLKTREEDEGILPQTTIQSFQNSFLGSFEELSVLYYVKTTFQDYE